MDTTHLTNKAKAYLSKLCIQIDERQVGSKGNRMATDFFAEQIGACGFAVDTPAFDCIDWQPTSLVLSAGGATFNAKISPFSLGCEINAPLERISTEADLQAADIEGCVLLMHGQIAREPLAPKSFPFYNPEQHQRIIRLLETKKPAAIIAATSRNVDMAGAMHPFPLIEDGDFDIPSVYMTEEEGARLAQHTWQEVTLKIQAQRRPAMGYNVIARKGVTPAGRRVVLCAHIDAKPGTPGALDDAGGTVVLLLLGSLLADYAGGLGVEIVAMNGEDYFNAPGEQQFLALNQGRFGEIVLGVNIDGIGYRVGKSAYSLYDCPPELSRAIQAAFASHSEFVEGEAWFQGDHSLFLMNQRPALALTSERIWEITSEFTHTPKDTLDLMDVKRLTTAAEALNELVRQLK
jgi:aminopeptidase YwaD